MLAANVAANDEAAGRVLSAVRRLDVDVFSVLELPPELARAYDAAGVRSLFPHRALRPLPGFEGTGLYSRLPLRAVPGPPGTQFGLAAAQLRPPGAAPVEIVRGPPARSEGSGRGRSMASRDADAADRGLRAGARAGRRFQRDARPRRAAARARPRLPGRRRAGGRRATPHVAGRPAHRARAVTIDHVLADRRVRVISVRSVAIPGSDHRGVLAELVLPRG